MQKFRAGQDVTKSPPGCTSANTGQREGFFTAKGQWQAGTQKGHEHTPLIRSNTTHPHPSTITALYHIEHIFNCRLKKKMKQSLLKRRTDS